MIHINFGLLKDRGISQLKTTDGLGLEMPIYGRCLGISEVYGDETQQPFYQNGMRYRVIPNVFQMDATTGQQIQGNQETQWLSIGLLHALSIYNLYGLSKRRNLLTRADFGGFTPLNHPIDLDQAFGHHTFALTTTVGNASELE